MSDELAGQYRGDDASAYEARRSADPKWQFEHESLHRVLQRYGHQIASIIDAPVGTGRFLELYASLEAVRVCGIDYSDDMLAIARRRAGTADVEFRRQDIIGQPLNAHADLVVCYRFVNLLPWQEAARVLAHLCAATNQVLVVAIRTIPDGYEGETFIEDKIHLHRRSAVDALARTSGFTVAEAAVHPTARAGDYCVMTLVRERAFREARVNKNGRLVYTYGASGNDGKVYEVKDAAHARFIRAVTNESELRGYFPHIRGITENFVDAEWSAGELLPAADWDRPLELLIAIQALETAQESSFDYVEDLVLPRFRRAMPLVGVEVCDRVARRVRELAARFDTRVSHPDVIPGNVVCDTTRLTLIDNELLCRSRHYRIDVLNVLNNLDASRRAESLATYLRLTGNSVASWESQRDYLTHLWVARQVGSFVVTNQMERAGACWQAWQHGDNILPYDVAALSR